VKTAEFVMPVLTVLPTKCEPYKPYRYADMKFERGQNNAKLPQDVGMLVHFSWAYERHPRFGYALIVLSHDEFIKQTVKADAAQDEEIILGRPALVTIDETDMTVHVWPAADDAGNLKVAYYPHMKEV
jgi:hypothetical protein